MLKMQKIADEIMGGNVDVKGYAERLAKLLEERETLNEDIKEIFAEASAKGIDKKALRAAVNISRQGKNSEHFITVNLYLERMGQPKFFFEA